MAESWKQGLPSRPENISIYCGRLKITADVLWTHENWQKIPFGSSLIQHRFWLSAVSYTHLVLAMAWLPRTGMMSGYYLLPSIGFLGHAHEYRPDLDRQWPDFFLKACLRGAEWGFKLHGHLTAAHRRLHDAASAHRPTSHLPALADLLIATPVLSASQAAKALHITSHSARAILSALEMCIRDSTPGRSPVPARTMALRCGIARRGRRTWVAMSNAGSGT